MATTFLIRVDVKSLDDLEKIRKNLGLDSLEYKEITEKALRYAANHTKRVLK